MFFSFLILNQLCHCYFATIYRFLLDAPKTAEPGFYLFCSIIQRHVCFQRMARLKHQRHHDSSPPSSINTFHTLLRSVFFASLPSPPSSTPPAYHFVTSLKFYFSCCAFAMLAVECFLTLRSHTNKHSGTFNILMAYR
jgi:hypothetical protein